MYYISFPGLGIEPFHIDKIAFTVFGHGIAWYGILITIGMLLAVALGLHLCKREGISSDDIIDLAFTVIVFGVIGARAYYVIFSWNDINYVCSDGTVWQNIVGTVYNCIAVWEGGLAIYGGVLGGLLSAFVLSKIKKVNYLKFTDILGSCVLVGQIIGRWGNFINIEAYGEETTLPWRMGITYMVNGSVVSEKFVHPTFLYESLWNLCVLALILLLYRKKKFDGQITATYFICYGIGRILIEGLRTDSLMLGNLRVSQGLSGILIVLGIVMYIVLGKKKKKEHDDACEYVSVYGEKTEENDDVTNNAASENESSDDNVKGESEDGKDN